MAGNTKLLGFSPNGALTLQRWGKVAIVEVGEEAVEKVMRACRDDLPSAPPEQEPVEDFLAGFDHQVGCVRVAMDMKTASAVADAMFCSTNPPFDTPELREWQRRLEVALSDWRRYQDKREPGIE